jgi:hypothetical protein
MNNKKTLTFATLGLLTGCGSSADLGGTEGPDHLGNGPETPASAPFDLGAVKGDLERLAQLSIVDVGALVLDYPEGAMNCYGPCPGFGDEIAEVDALQAARLHELVEIATEAATLSLQVEECSVEVIDENLAALDGLDIVEVFGMVEEVPQNNPYCYNLPCEEDIARAEEINCQRATALAHIAEEASQL